MIGGDLLVKLNKEAVLSKISDYDIYKYYMPHQNWEVDRPTYSPFREERNPSFLIYFRDGRLSHIDFAQSHCRGGCTDFVQQLYGIGYDQALRKIDQDFNLGISFKRSADGVNYRQIVSQYSQPVAPLEKKYSHIQVITKRFNNDELAYWNSYHQDIQDLAEENIYSVKRVFLNRKEIFLKKNQMTFGYLYGNSWKIYQPFNKEFKWVPNNVPITIMDGMHRINNVDTLFINKSKKDYMVIKKIYEHTCAVQNEGIACFSEENVKFIRENSKRQVLSFDSDEPGVKNSTVVTQQFGFDYCNVPRYYLQEGIKDWADLAKAHGMKE